MTPVASRIANREEDRSALPVAPTPNASFPQGNHVHRIVRVLLKVRALFVDQAVGWPGISGFWTDSSPDSKRRIDGEREARKIRLGIRLSMERAVSWKHWLTIKTHLARLRQVRTEIAMPRSHLGLFCSLIMLTGGTQTVAQVTLEYIAHACFVVENTAGQRLVIDPYNGSRWLGYDFPQGIRADGVLITHPHYDHDASYYFELATPVLRSPGEYSLAGFHIRGIRGKHADPYGTDFNQSNTIWVIEADGVRLAHLGDNGPLGPDVLRQMGRIDVLLAPIDSTFHILNEQEISGSCESSQSHLPGSDALPDSAALSGMRDLGPVDPWLASQQRVERIQGNRHRIKNSEQKGVLVFSPSQQVKSWPSNLVEAWEALGKARRRNASSDASQRENAFNELRRAHQLAPDELVFSYWLARGMEAAGQADSALSLLQTALSNAADADWGASHAESPVGGQILHRQGPVQTSPSSGTRGNPRSLSPRIEGSGRSDSRELI